MQSSMMAGHPYYSCQFGWIVQGEIMYCGSFGGKGRECDESSSERGVELALMLEFSSDTGTDLEDELCHFRLLLESLHYRRPV